MTTRISLIMLLVFLACVPGFPQKRTRRTVRKTLVIEPLSPPKKEPAPYQINLKIAEGPEYFVSIVSSFGPDDMSRRDIGGPDMKSFLSHLANGSDGLGRTDSVTPNVSIDASPKITMRDLWNAIAMFPRDKANIRMFIPGSSIPSGRMRGGMSLDLPWERNTDKQELDVKPNPLLLVVTVDGNDRLSLNNEVFGSLSDPEPLVQFLLKIFKEREENGVFAEGTNSIEKTVSIVMPASGRTVAQLIAITEAVRAPGGEPINLIAESPLNFSIDNRKELLILPKGLPTRP